VNVEIATSQSLSRIWRLALVGTATAFAWIVLSLLLGLGSGSAHATDGDDDGNGLLGAVTSLVDRTASAVTGTVTTVAGGVTGVVNTVVDVAPAPVQEPVRQVVGTVGTVVTTATKPVTDVVSGGVVGSVTQPIVDVVTQVPIVGGVVSGIGLDDAVTDLGGTVDDTLGGLVGAVTDTTSGIGLPPGTTPLPGGVLPPLVPGVPATVEPGDAVAATAGVSTPAAASPGGGLSAFEFYAAVPLLPADSAVVSASDVPSGTRGALPSAGGLCPPTASSSGPGGTGLGAWAFLALGPFAALRAWVRRAGPENDDAPPAPVGSTDVSPD
jgi:hypothetical protein